MLCQVYLHAMFVLYLSVCTCIVMPSLQHPPSLLPMWAFLLHALLRPRSLLEENLGGMVYPCAENRKLPAAGPTRNSQHLANPQAAVAAPGTPLKAA